MAKQYVLKKMYILFIGLFYAFFTFGYEGFHAVAIAGISYLAMFILPKTLSPKFVFIFTWSYLSFM
jgi:hypothetical protein